LAQGDQSAEDHTRLGQTDLGSCAGKCLKIRMYSLGAKRNGTLKVRSIPGHFFAGAFVAFEAGLCCGFALSRARLASSNAMRT
jgi:hypothetical protein